MAAPRILYISITSRPLPRDAVYLEGFKAQGAEIIEMRDNVPGIRKLWNIYCRHAQLPKDNYDVVFVGYVSQIVVPLARLMSRKPIVFNALATLSKGVHARAKRGWNTWGFVTWLFDLFAYHAAHINLIENNVLIDVIAREFFVPRSKLVRAWTGVDARDFFYDPSIKKLPTFTVLWRGELAADVGVQYIVEAARNLANTNIRFRFIGRGFMVSQFEKMLGEFDSKNVEWIRERVSIEDLRRLMQECHLSIGNLSMKYRGFSAIPHKIFESLALKVPLLVGRLPGLQELLQEHEAAFFCNPDDPEDLTRAIRVLAAERPQLDAIAERAYQLYQSTLTSSILAGEILMMLRERRLIR